MKLQLKSNKIERREARLQYFDCLAVDLKGHGVSAWHPSMVYRRPELHYQRIMRAVEYYSALPGKLNKAISLAYKFRLLRQSARTGIQLPAGVAAKGLSIAHYGSIVINAEARIGSWCRLHSATNIGSAGGGAPRIGNFVYIGPGAVLYGEITVGDGAVIGANSVVNKDVPPGVTVAGSPARVISNRGSASIMPKWFPSQ